MNQEINKKMKKIENKELKFEILYCFKENKHEYASHKSGS